MMQIWMKLDVDRDEGKQESAQAVGEALASQLEGESVDVEDSTFTVTSAEVGTSPKASADAGIKVTSWLALDELFKEHMERFPISIDGPPVTEEPTRTDNLVMALMFDPGFGAAITKARVAFAKMDKAANR